MHVYSISLLYDVSIKQGQGPIPNKKDEIQLLEFFEQFKYGCDKMICNRSQSIINKARKYLGKTTLKNFLNVFVPYVQVKEESINKLQISLLNVALTMIHIQ